MPTQSKPDAIETFSALLKLLMDNPDNVTLKAEPSANGTVLLCAEVTRREKGKLIGVSGRTARALRIILTNLGLAQGARYSLDIIERS